MKKTVYVPKGQTKSFDDLTCDRLIVNGMLKVESGITARQIQGKGIISAEIIKADSIVCGVITAGRIISNELMAKQIQAGWIHSASCLSVATYIEAEYVKTPKAILAESEIEELHAGEVISLKPKQRSLWTMLISSMLRSLWVDLLCWLRKTLEEASEKSRTEARPNVKAEQSVIQNSLTDNSNSIPASDDDGVKLSAKEVREFLRIFNELRERKQDGVINPVAPMQEKPHQFTVAQKVIDINADEDSYAA